MGFVAAVAMILGVAYVGIKLAPARPTPSAAISVTPDFPIESAGPTVVAFDAVQSHIERFGALPSTKEFIATIHAAQKSADVSCFTVTVSVDDKPALYLLEVANSSLEVRVSVNVGSAWVASGTDGATECERLEPAPPG